MGWLLELLLDGIREICSQFIVDMMELVTEMFTELLSCDLSLFEDLFSVVGVLYQNVIVPMGIAMLLLILVWQLFKSMFGKSVDGEEPVELVIRSAIALFFVVAAKPIVNYILKFAGTPYQWVVGTEIKVESFSGFVSALEGVTETLGIGTLSISLLMLIMQFVVAWNYFKMLFVIAERYVLLGVFSYTAPLAFSTGGSKSTNNILASWSKMFGGQVVLIILNAWCMKMFLSGYGNLMASSYGFTKFFVATLCLVGFCKITFKMDSYLASLGVNLGRPSAGMGAMGLIMAASRIFSQIGRSGAGNGGGTPGPEGETSPERDGGMQEGFTEPIPMMDGNMPSSGNMPEMPSGGGFEETTDNPGGFGTSGYSEQETDGSSVLEEMGIVTAENTERATGTDANTEIGRAETAGIENSSSRENLSGDKGITEPGMEEETSMDMSVSGIPEYTEEAGTAEGAGILPGTEIPEDAGSLTGTEVTDGVGLLNRTDTVDRADILTGTDMETGAGLAMGTGIANGVASADGGSRANSADILNGQASDAAGMGIREESESFAYGAGYGNSDAGIISEMGDYPVEEEFADGMDEDVMELDGSTIDSMGSGEEAESVSCGNAGDAFGNTSLASGSAAGQGTAFHSGGRTGGILGTAPFQAPEGVISEVGTDFETDSFDSYDMAGASGSNLYEGSVNPENGRTGMPDAAFSEDSDENIGGSSGNITEGGMDLESGSIAPYGTTEVTGESGNLQQTGMGAGTGERAVLDDSGFSSVAGEKMGNTADALSGITPSMNSAGVSDKADGDSDFGSETNYEDGGSPGITGETPAIHESAGHVSEMASMPDEGNTEENPYMAEKKLNDSQTSLENTDYSREPIEKMDGQMNHMQPGGPIPAGNRKEGRRRKPAREFREVPKTREELRRRQQERKEQKISDGIPLERKG